MSSNQIAATPETSAAVSTNRVEAHYDAQANTHDSREAYQRDRREGPLIGYKSFANNAKRRLLKNHTRCGDKLVDLACGRGGDLNKWRDAELRRVVALDLSAEQLTDAKRRKAEDRPGGPDVAWVHGSMTDPGLEAHLRAHGAVDADAVSIMFAVQFACGSQRDLDGLLGTVARILKPGGAFLGVAPDADAVEAKLGATDEYRSPSDWPFSLLLRLLPRSTDPAAGQPLVFSLQDTVTSGSDATACVEYLCGREMLAARARAHDLELVATCSLAEEPGAASLSEAEREVAGLYFTFAFRKLATAPPPRVGVAVYTGSFDPVHENHIALCKHVLNDRGLSCVYLVSNGENPTKPNLTPRRVRCDMVDARLAEPDCAGIRRYETDVGLDWRGRHEVCQRLKRLVCDEYGCAAAIDMYQILGQDSFEDRGGFQHAHTRHTYMQGRTMLVLPRSTSEAPAVIPSDWSRDVRIEVLRDYSDPHAQLSSTRLRKTLSNPLADPAAPAAGIHPSVWRTALARRLYMARGAPSMHRMSAILLGEPFSGKTTLAAELLRRLPGLRYIAGGDLHRAACKALPEQYGNGKKLGPLLGAFNWACQAEATRLLGAVGVRAIITDAKPKDLRGDYAFSQARRLAAFEPADAPTPHAELGFDVISVLSVSAETLTARSNARASRVGDWHGAERRLANPGNLREALKDLQRDSPGAKAALLDGECKTAALADKVEAELRAAAAAKGLDLDQAQSVTADATFLQQVVASVWAADKWRPAPPPPVAPPPAAPGPAAARYVPPHMRHGGGNGLGKGAGRGAV